MTPFTISFALVAFAVSTIAAPHSVTTSNSTSSAPASSTATSNFNNSSHQSGGEEYVVLFDSLNMPDVTDVLTRIGLSADHPDIHHIYNNSAFHGFSASMKSHCIDALNGMDDVLHVEKDATVKTQDYAYARHNSPWGLQRISSAGTVTGDPQGVDFIYTFSDSKLGENVDIYVIDTGINAAHAAFGNRARMAYSSFKDSTDQDGHGTHVAGTAAASVFGVASGANIIGVKVLGADGQGNVGATTNGMDWVIQQHDLNKNRPGFVGSIMSMSWAVANGPNAGVQYAIQTATTHGIHVSVAAGNAGKDACGYSPSSSGGTQGSAVTVGSIGSDDRISSFSNTGQCVDVYAPGEDIMSTWNTGNNVVQILSGTSMATPHVTGLMAYLMAEHPELAANPSALKAYLKQTAVQKNGILIANNGVKSTHAKRVKRALGMILRESGSVLASAGRRVKRGLMGLDRLIAALFDDKERETQSKAQQRSERHSFQKRQIPCRVFTESSDGAGGVWIFQAAQY